MGPVRRRDELEIQNNLQGASDAGLIPMMYPDYHRVDEAAARELVARARGVRADRLDPSPGLTVVEVTKAALAGRLKGPYIMGENPAMSDPDAEYPLVLITGRQLEHWHTGSMTRRSAVLDAIEPDPVALVHPLELERLGIQPGELMTVATRRGHVSLYARADEGTPEGAVFVAFCWAEAAINRLTNPALDPVAKIPEFKYCAVKVTRGGEALAEGSFGHGHVMADVMA